MLFFLSKLDLFYAAYLKNNDNKFLLLSPLFVLITIINKLAVKSALYLYALFCQQGVFFSFLIFQQEEEKRYRSIYPSFSE